MRYGFSSGISTRQLGKKTGATAEKSGAFLGVSRFVIPRLRETCSAASELSALGETGSQAAGTLRPRERPTVSPFES